jgi:hypothetical protein
VLFSSFEFCANRFVDDTDDGQTFNFGKNLLCVAKIILQKIAKNCYDQKLKNGARATREQNWTNATIRNTNT